MDTVACLEPPLRWPGGKRWLVPLLAELFAPHRNNRLVDPFCGGLAVPLELRPRQALLSDVNAGLIEFYQIVQRGLVIDHAPIRSKEEFLAARERYNAILGQPKSARERAVLYYMINRTCYRGTTRVNVRGQLNCTYGHLESRTFAEDFVAYREVFAPWTFRCRDAAELELEPEDFVYADPPYEGQAEDCAPHVFTWKEQKALAERLAEHPGPVVISNSGTERAVGLYEDLGYKLLRIRGPQPAARVADLVEILAVRNLG